MSALSLGQTAKKRAERLRAEWLASLSMGVITVPDFLEASTHEETRALRRVTLRQLLETQEGWGRARAQRAISETLHILGTNPTARLTVAWLIDARAGGRRVHAFANALQERVLPWPGFPYAPCPQEGALT